MSSWRSETPDAGQDARGFLARHPTLHDLLQAGGEVLEVVIQDEYTHDVIATIPTPAGRIIAVFDST